MACSDGGKMWVFWIETSFMLAASIGSAITGQALYKASNFGYLRSYRKRILSDEIMIQTIIISNILLFIYPCFAFRLTIPETLLIVIFITLEVGPLIFILYTLF